MVLEIFVGFASTLGQVFLKFFDPLPSPRILAISNSSQERLRGRHTLVRTPEGVLSCTACYLCQTGCPADCIHIEVDPVSAPASHLRPSVFTIDELKCIQCGLCVEACPYDAIRMDTGKFAPPLLPEDIVRSRRYDLLAVVSEMNELKS
ncbi:MAG: 4Fe-4S binding protein [Myxococcales bacterium]|nr:4Fe-4S binding protein [Myxococcales bacterium]